MTEQQQIIMLKMPNSVELLRKMAAREMLWDNAEVAMLNAPNSVELFKAYVYYNHLTKGAKELMFKHENSGEFLAIYIANQIRNLSSDDEVKIMSHPDAKKLARIYREHSIWDYLCMDAVKEMFRLNDIGLIRDYVTNVGLPVLRSLMTNITDYPNAEIAARYVLQNTSDLLLSLDQQLEILKLENAEELIRIYVYNKRSGLSNFYRSSPLCSAFVRKMATMSDGPELMNICISYGLM